MNRRECVESYLQNGWTPIKIARPDKPGKYIVCAVEAGKYKHVTTALYQIKAERFELRAKAAHWRVTHWMPMPPPPLDGKEIAEEKEKAP